MCHPVSFGSDDMSLNDANSPSLSHRKEITQKIWDYLKINYCASKSFSRFAYVIKFSDMLVSSHANEGIDGTLGCALLTDITHNLDIGSILKRETLKDIIHCCLRRLGCPLRYQTKYTGAFRQCRVAVDTKMQRPKYVGLLTATIAYILRRVPAELQAELKNFGGDWWWGVCSAESLPQTDQWLQSFTIQVHTETLKSVFKHVAPFPCNIIHFGNGISLYAEWNFDRSLLWIRTSDCYLFILLLRHVRKSYVQKKNVRIINVQGYGSALI